MSCYLASSSTAPSSSICSIEHCFLTIEHSPCSMSSVKLACVCFFLRGAGFGRIAAQAALLFCLTERNDRGAGMAG